MRNQSLLSLLATGATISWVFFICVVGAAVRRGAQHRVRSLVRPRPAFLPALAVRKLLARPSVNL